MKKLSYSLIFVLVCAFSGYNSFAQNPIPSYNNPVIVGETFEEEDEDFIFFMMSMEERKLKIGINDPNQSQFVEWAIIEYYSLDGTFISNPLYVDENNSLEINIDNRKYGVRVLSKSENCQISVWTTRI